LVARTEYLNAQTEAIRLGEIANIARDVANNVDTPAAHNDAHKAQQNAHQAQQLAEYLYTAGRAVNSRTESLGLFARQQAGNGAGANSPEPDLFLPFDLFGNGDGAVPDNSPLFDNGDNGSLEANFDANDALSDANDALSDANDALRDANEKVRTADLDATEATRKAKILETEKGYGDAFDDQQKARDARLAALTAQHNADFAGLVAQQKAELANVGHVAAQLTEKAHRDAQAAEKARHAQLAENARKVAENERQDAEAEMAARRNEDEAKKARRDAQAARRDAQVAEAGERAEAAEAAEAAERARHNNAQEADGTFPWGYRRR